MRILFVCFADSTHSQSWINLLEKTDFEVRVYANNFYEGGMYPPIPWERTTYILSEPLQKRGNAKIISAIPNNRLVDFIARRLIYRFPLNLKYFQWVVSRWKPDIVHGLSLNPASVFAWQGLKNIKADKRPLFVTSSWGSDINLGKDNPAEKSKLQEVLANCDGFVADCKRDIQNALDLGLDKNKVAFNFAIPVTGGIDIGKSHSDLFKETRDVILIPKAYEGVANKTLPVLEALNLIADKLTGYKIHLLMCSPEVKAHLSRMPANIRDLCTCHAHVSKEQVTNLMNRSRMMVAPSLSDGTPISMLEAMSAGVLPVVSPIQSIKEWIRDGENGLLVHALHPNQIASALERALTDDELLKNSSQLNYEIIKTRANRDLIRSQVTNFYEKLVTNK